MGTNYYAVKVEPSIYNSMIHIGKSSGGWLFLFHDCEFFHTYPQVRRWLREHISLKKEYVLMNEYDEIVDVEEFIMLVQNKQNDRQCKNNPDNFKYCRNIDGYRFTEGDFC